MKGDFSRWNAKENKNHNGVLHQQGRVLTDNDWNAGTRLLNAWQEQAGRDTIGPGVAAVPAEAPGSFKVQAAVLVSGATTQHVELDILPGRVWADGLLTHLTGDANAPAAAIKRTATYLEPPFQAAADNESNIAVGVRDAVVLEVWQEALNAFQVPGQLLEPALGGIDTTERVHTSMAFRLLRLKGDERCEDVPEILNRDVNKGSLVVTLAPPETISGDCPLEEGGGYSGFEHHLYRIEIARLDDMPLTLNGPMFKWSRFNGGLVGRGEFSTSPDKLKITGNYQAINASGLTSIYLEALEYDETLGHWKVTYGATASLDGTNEVDLTGTTYYGEIPASEKSVFFRIWDGIEPIRDFPLSTSSKKPVPLADGEGNVNGIRLEFESDTGNNYKPGDYWTFEVRAGGIGNPPVNVPIFSLSSSSLLSAGSPYTALKNEFDANGFPLSDSLTVTVKTAGAEWLIADSVTEESYTVKDEAGTLNVYHMTLIKMGPPDGIRFHRVPLAILEWDGSTGIDERFIYDCRRIYRPLTDLVGCCTFTVGKGGDFQSIQQAVNHLPGSGGIVCLLPGIFAESVTIEKKENIVIRGCDNRTILLPPESEPEKPIFHIKDSLGITLENMDMEAYGGTAVLMQADHGKLNGIHVRNNRILAYTHAVCVEGGECVHIVGNIIRMLDREDGDVAVFLDADDSLIEGNDITVVPLDELEPGIDIPGGGVIPNPAEPCINLEIFIQYRSQLQIYLNRIWLFAFKVSPFRAAAPMLFNTPGGIQIAGSTMGIRIRKNRISGGSGNGITLGNIPKEAAVPYKPYRNVYGIDIMNASLKYELTNAFSPFIYDLEIEKNHIRCMGLNGIGMVNFFSLKNIGIMVSIEDMTIYRNIIEECLQQVAGRVISAMSMEMGIGGISLADVENLVIRENRIENNGTGQPEPVSGIFILHGEKIDISDNRILNNGSGSDAGAKGAKPGMRGGIVIASSFRQLDKKTLSLNLITEDQSGDFMDWETGEHLYYDGIPAVKVHDNIVTQPLGQVLFIMTLGPVSVIGNHFTSQGTDFLLNPLSLLAGAVTIINMGASKDMAGRRLFPSFKLVADFNDRDYSPEEAKEGSSGPEYGLPGVYVEETGTDSEDSADSIYTYEPSLNDYLQDSKFSWNEYYTVDALIPVQIFHTLRHLPSGNVLFADNQIFLDLHSPDPGSAGVGNTGMFNLNFSLSSLFIASMDDVSFTGNQSECTALTEIVISNAVVVGVTVRTNDNRFQEGRSHSFFSLVSLGFMNTADANQSTHCLMVLGPPAFTKNLPSNTSFSGKGPCKKALGWLRLFFNIFAPLQYGAADLHKVFD